MVQRHFESVSAASDLEASFYAYTFGERSCVWDNGYWGKKAYPEKHRISAHVCGYHYLMAGPGTPPVCICTCERADALHVLWDGMLRCEPGVNGLDTASYGFALCCRPFRSLSHLLAESTDKAIIGATEAHPRR